MEEFSLCLSIDIHICMYVLDRMEDFRGECMPFRVVVGFGGSESAVTKVSELTTE
jgi:hypothetical protein